MHIMMTARVLSWWDPVPQVWAGSVCVPKPPGPHPPPPPPATTFICDGISRQCMPGTSAHSFKNLSSCQTACKPPPPPSYTCDKTNTKCVADAKPKAGGLNQTACAHKCHCTTSMPSPCCSADCEAKSGRTCCDPKPVSCRRGPACINQSPTNCYKQGPYWCQ